MMNSEEFRRSVYERAAEYKAERQRKQRTAVKYASVCVCFCVLVGIIAGRPLIRDSVNETLISGTTSPSDSTVASTVADTTSAQTTPAVTTDATGVIATTDAIIAVTTSDTAARTTAGTQATTTSQTAEEHNVYVDDSELKYAITFYGNDDEIAILSTLGSVGSRIERIAVADSDEYMSRFGLDVSMISAGYDLPDEAFFDSQYLVFIYVRGVQSNVLHDELIDIWTLTYGADDEVNLYLYKAPRGSYTTFRLDVE